MKRIPFAFQHPVFTTVVDLSRATGTRQQFLFDLYIHGTTAMTSDGLDFEINSIKRVDELGNRLEVMDIIEWRDGVPVTEDDDIYNATRAHCEKVIANLKTPSHECD